jgi:hypothetical protein
MDGESDENDEDGVLYADNKSCAGGGIGKAKIGVCGGDVCDDVEMGVVINLGGNIVGGVGEGVLEIN